MDSALENSPRERYAEILESQLFGFGKKKGGTKEHEQLWEVQPRLNKEGLELLDRKQRKTLAASRYG